MGTLGLGAPLGVPRGAPLGAPLGVPLPLGLPLPLPLKLPLGLPLPLPVAFPRCRVIVFFWSGDNAFERLGGNPGTGATGNVFASGVLNRCEEGGGFGIVATCGVGIVVLSTFVCVILGGTRSTLGGGGAFCKKLFDFGFDVADTPGGNRVGNFVGSFVGFFVG